MAKLYFLFAVLFLVHKGDALDEARVCKVPKTPESRRVQIAQGPVLGYKDPAGLYAFYDIPYATAPTGRDKFRGPLPPPTWTDTFEAVDRKVMCPQPFREPDMGPKTEDCLVASVYTPDTNRTNLPVYAIIHGGAYQFGFGNAKMVREIVQSREIIAVTYNYRLSVHGLLCLGTEAVPGNAGMKDQVAALRWIKENIASFGGNPDDITLSGSSAGASSAELLMISKSAQGLFNKVIVQSGSAVAAWSADAEPVEKAMRYAQKLNFTNVDSIEALEEFYRNTPVDVLMSVQFASTMRYGTMFSPCVERNFGEETFMEKAPVDIIKSGDYAKVPILYGYCDKEGIFKVAVEKIFDVDSKKMNEEPNYHVPLDLKFETAEEEERVAKRLKEFYFGNRIVDHKSVEGYIDFQSDSLFIYTMLRSVKLYAEAGHDQLYLFEYSFPTEHVLFENVTSRGATHTAQATAVFDETNEKGMAQNIRKIKAVMRDLWYNFVATGSPVPPGSKYPAWPPVQSPNRVPYMVLDSKLSLKWDFPSPLKDRIQLWDEIYDNYYKTPTAPGL